MIQAAAEGALDFREAAHVDRRFWNRKVRWITDCLERRNLLAALQDKFQQHLAVAKYGTDPQTFDHHWGQSNNLYRKMVRTRFPWLNTTPEDPRAVAIQMRKDYVDAYGDPNDPEVAAQIEALVAHWDAQAKQGR